MPRGVWSPKRERQYEHILSTCMATGRRPKKVCTRIAAATVNKARAARGETKKRKRRARGASLGCGCGK